MDAKNGNQPDHKRHEIPIRHWDGYWFGRNRMFGDTLHQHSAFSAANAQTPHTVGCHVNNGGTRKNVPELRTYRWVSS